MTVTRHPSEGYGLTFEYAPRMVQAIKTRVPSSERRYDQATRTWWLYRRTDLEALRSATNGWATFTVARKSTMSDFRVSQATIQARNAEARTETRKLAILCRHCEQPITMKGHQWVHASDGSPWCGIETHATPKGSR